MSNVQYAFISRSRVPNRSELQSSIDALGFDLKLHPEHTPFEDSGFLPFTLNGEEGPGFEIQYVPTSEVIAGDKSLQEIAAGRDHCISMAWHGSMKDLACVLIVSCALIKDFESVVSYEGDPPEPLENLLSEIPGVLLDAQAQEARTTNRPVHIEKKKPWWKIW
ncbi:hypothetical protein [Thiobacillus sp.]|uniref:hypothetical protein n=1 Tax=Thiobacillus sp. TaxID=924 RepID=UPI0025FA5E5D|nr:hypothetical protein [Thiobacillus sp.]MBT9539927.1 hypothetical protein [Thiobacillus sp.]